MESSARDSYSLSVPCATIEMRMGCASTAFAAWRFWFSLMRLVTSLCTLGLLMGCQECFMALNWRNLRNARALWRSADIFSTCHGQCPGTAWSPEYPWSRLEVLNCKWYLEDHITVKWFFNLSPVHNSGAVAQTQENRDRKLRNNPGEIIIELNTEKVLELSIRSWVDTPGVLQ